MSSSSLNPLSRLSSWLKGAENEVEETANKAADYAKGTLHEVEAAGRGVIDTYERNHGTRGPETTYRFSSKAAEERNFRDVATSTAGRVTADGKHLRPRMVLRADAPVEADLASLKSLGVATEIDLRSNVETLWERLRGKSPSWRGSKIAYKHFAVGSLDAYDTNAKDRDRAIANSLLTIADTRKPVIIHCTHGVDRTGMTVATLMMALGFSRDAAREEYLRSTASPEGYGATAANFDTAWDDIIGRYGSFSGYLNHLHQVQPKFDPAATVATLRTVLLR